MTRIMVCRRDGTPVGDLDLGLCEVLEMREELNGEHSLEVETTQELAEGMRLLHLDATGKVREWVIDECEDGHATDGLTHRYGATWSIQYDLAASPGAEVWASASPGTHDPTTPALALRAALSSQSMWEAGNVTFGDLGACSLYDASVWEYLAKLIDTFGGEMEPRITVDGSGRVTHRYVDWLAHVGTQDVTRRFDFGEDCTEIRRTVPAGPRYSRVRPRGGGSKTDDDGVDYSERVGIEGITAADMAEFDGWELVSGTTYANGDLRFTLGTDYIEDASAAADFDWGNHPTATVTYDVAQLANGTPDDCELFERCAADVLSHTRPQATYEAEVEQYSQAGMDAHGVALGDEVHVVDRTFGSAALRLESRVVEVVTNLLVDGDVSLTIGATQKTLGQAFREVRQNAQAQVDAITQAGTLVYVEELLDRINSEMNTTGAWKYEVPGDGTYYYDRAVTDPKVGSEATRAIKIGGGYIRFANTKDSAGNWVWTNVITADGYIGLAATIAKITTGYIGNPSDGTYWDLDNGRFRIGPATTIDSGATIGQTRVSDLPRSVDVEYAVSASKTEAPTSGWSTNSPTVEPGKYVWTRTKVVHGIGGAADSYTKPACISGDDGKAVKAIKEQYYLSTSKTACKDGSWADSQPTWVSGRYIWTRSHMTYDNGTTGTTTPVLANAVNDANESAHAASSSLASYIMSNNEAIGDLQGQIDGAVDIWYGSGEPTSSTRPWGTTDADDNHVGDMYYDTVTGNAYRYNGSGQWLLMPDQNAADALATAQEASALADGKRRVFTAQPKPPYDVGDLWVKSPPSADTQDVPVGRTVLYSTVRRDTGSFVSSDWVTTATDNAYAEYVMNEANNGISNEASARAGAVSNLSKRMSDFKEGFDITLENLTMGIANAAKGATDFLRYERGENDEYGTLYIGTTDSPIRAALSPTLFSFQTDAGHICYFGQNALGIWEMFIQTATVQDRLSFGDFSWIARQNGNMTLKWVGNES